MKRVSQWLFAMCDTSNSVPYMIKFNRWMTPSICTYQYFDFLQSTSFSYINCIPSSNDLRNESNIFSVDRGFKLSTKQGRKTASMRVEHCCRSFPFFFRSFLYYHAFNVWKVTYFINIQRLCKINTKYISPSVYPPTKTFPYNIYFWTYLMTLADDVLYHFTRKGWLHCLCCPIFTVRMLFRGHVVGTSNRTYLTMWGFDAKSNTLSSFFSNERGMSYEKCYISIRLIYTTPSLS